MPINKRDVTCNICGCGKYTILFKDELKDSAPKLDYNFTEDTRKTYRIVRCDSCNLIYTNPMPHISSLYEDIVDEVYLESREQRKRTAEKYIQEIRKFKQHGDLLDIGCSVGILLDIAVKYFNVEGIEMSGWAYSEAIKRHKIYNRPLSELCLQKRYDVVTLFGVIEHFEDPKKEMTSIYNILKPDGLVVIYTGNVDAWFPRLLGKKWWWFQGMHIFYFSKKTCRLLLERCGFDTAMVKTPIAFFQLFSLAIAFRRYKFGKILQPILNFPFVRKLMIPLKLSGEMLLFALKKTS